ncbi:MAG: hypothetical protein AAGH41_09635 [Pseudomonadota bacterium]
MAEFYHHHFMAHESFADDEAVHSFSGRYDTLADRVRSAPCTRHTDLLDKLRVYEVCFLEDGGDYLDGRELAWMGSLQADILKLRDIERRDGGRSGATSRRAD